MSSISDISDEDTNKSSSSLRAHDGSDMSKWCNSGLSDTSDSIIMDINLETHNGPTKNQDQDKLKPEQSNISRAARWKKRKEDRKKKEEELSDPSKILDKILADSKFKVANLSQIVDKKFYEPEDHGERLCLALSDVVYTPTVGCDKNAFSDVLTSVFPEGFTGKVHLLPSAFLNMKCIHEPPEKRWARRGKKGNKKKPAEQSQNKSTTDPATSKVSSSTKATDLPGS